MIWRQIGSVNALTRIVQKEAILWEQPRKVSQQAMSQRLTSLPSELFLRVLMDILPIMRDRWMERERPLPAELKWVAERYRAILAVDESTLYALIRKIGLLKDLPENPLAGRMTAFFKRRFGETAKKAKQMMTELSKTVGVAFHGKRGSVPSVYREGNTNQRLVEPRPTKGV